MYAKLTPASQLIAPDDWPVDFLQSDRGDSLLDSVYVVDSSVVAGPDSLTFSIRALFAGELALSLPGLDALTLVLGVPVEEPPPPEPETDFAFDPGFGEGWTEVALSLEVGAAGWTLTLRDVACELRVAPGLLRPVDGGDQVRIALRGTIAIDDAFEVTVSGFDAFDLGACEIGQTGLILAAAGVALDLGRLSSPPAVLSAGFDESFLGAYLGTATVQLPSWLATVDGQPVVLDVTGGTLGSGGFGGRIGYAGGELAARLFGFAFALETTDSTFVQNAVTAGAIAGRLTLPFFDAELGVAVTIGADGAVGVALTDPGLGDGLVSVPLGALGGVQLSHLEIDAATPAIVVGGTFVPGELPGLSLPTVSIDGLRIASDGSVSIEGDGLTLSDQVALDLYGFLVEVTAVTLGTEVRDGVPWNWLGFSGAIRLGDGIPAGASARGVRLLTERGGPGFAVECDGVGLAFAIPDVLEIDGSVSLAGREFVGDVRFALTGLDLTVDASAVAGQQGPEGATYAYLKVALDASLPLGIPLGSTGLALYGLSGLFALNMAPDQNAGPLSGRTFDWYADWYEAWGQPWAPRRGALGLGVGVTLGTLVDNGYTFADTVALVLSFPGPVIMLQGVGNILRARSSLPDRSTFTSLILFDGGAGDLLAALAMDYDLPADGPLAGRLLQAGGTAEAYFDLNDADNWHVYLGQSPLDRRIRASVLDLFQADAYVMLQPPKLKAGASIGYSDNWDFKVVAASLTATLSGDAKVSWAPQHLVADLDFAGNLTLKAFGFGGGLSLAAGVHVETPTPYSVALDLAVALDLPWPFPDPEVDINLAWSEPADPTPEAPVVFETSARGYVTTDAWTLPLSADPNLANDDSFYPSQDGRVLPVPLDARPAVVFNRNVEDVAGVGTPRPANAPDVVESDLDGQTEFLYRLTELTLQKWAVGDSGAPEWTGDLDLTDATGAAIKGLEVYGNWQATGDAAGTQLELFGDGPFSFCRDNTSTRSGQAADAPAWTPYVDGFLSTRSTYPTLSLEPTVVDFEAYADGRDLGQQFVHDGLTFESDVDVIATDLTGTAAGGRMSLPLAALDSLTIRFPEPVGQVVLRVEGWSRPGQLPGIPTDVRGVAVRGTLDDGSTVLQAVDLGVWQSPTLVEDVALEARFAAVTGLELRGTFAYVLGLSYVPWATAIEQVEDLIADGERQLGPRPLLLPDTDYRLTIRTETVTTTPAGTTTAPGPVQYAFFRTAGPPADLTPYLAATTPARGGGPYFGGYDLRFEFNQNYVLAMYGHELTVGVVDENGAPVDLGVAGPTVLLGGLSAAVPYTTSVWLGALADAGLLADESAQPAGNDVLVAWAADSLPAARRLEARVLYRGDPVLSVPFTTSSYPDFGALVAAFDPTIWDETLAGGGPSAADLAELQALATERAGASGPFADAEGEEFERALYELLGCGTRPIPTRPGLTALRADGQALALLLELPEPLDWDRLSVTIGGVPGSRGPALVRGRDQTRALLLIPGAPRASRPKAWAPGAYMLTFAYRLDPGDGSLPILTRRGSSAPETPPPVTLVVADAPPPALRHPTWRGAAGVSIGRELVRPRTPGGAG